MSRPPRRHDRVNAVVPVRMDSGKEGITRDLSPAGVYFVTGENLRPGEVLRFTVEFDSPSGKLFLDCSGEVVRVEDANGRTGVAVKITESRLERSDNAAAASAPV
jgi:hypothetical protein